MRCKKLLWGVATSSVLMLFYPLAIAQSINTDWNMFQGNAQHTGYVHDSLNMDNVEFIWSRELSDQQVGNEIKPIVANSSSAFLTISNTLYKLNNTNGNIIWSKQFSGAYNVTAPSLDKGNVFIRTVQISESIEQSSFRYPELIQGELISLNGDSGFVNFKMTFESSMSRNFPPTIYRGYVYTTCGVKNGVCAFKADSGELIWSKPLNFYQFWTPAVTEKFVVTQTNAISVFDRQTGDLIFEHGEPEVTDFQAYLKKTAVIGDMDNVISNYTGETPYGKFKDALKNVDLNTHTVNWEHRAVYQQQPVVGNGVVYSALFNGDIKAYSEKSGKLLWQWKNESVSQRIYNLIIFDNVLLVSTHMDTYAIDLNSHKTIWSYPKGGYISYANNILYLGANNGSIYAFKISSITPYSNSTNNQPVYSN